MRYFTYEWAIGNEETNALEQYNQFLATLDIHSDVWRFATSISLNDAWPDHVIFRRAEQSLNLLLLTGDLQVGYWHTNLSYTGVQIAGEDVLKKALANRPSEIWYDEFAQEDERLSHSFLLAGENLKYEGEFTISFETFHFSQTAAQSRHLKTIKDTSIWK